MRIGGQVLGPRPLPWIRDMTSKYLQCDRCGSVLDRRPLDDHQGDGTYGYSQIGELETRAKSEGWQVANHIPGVDSVDYCPKCTPEGYMKRALEVYADYANGKI